MLTKDNMMSTPQCDKCGLYSCSHKTELTQPITSVSLGESVGNSLAEEQSTRIRIGPIQQKNTICMHCSKTVSDENFCSECGEPLYTNVMKPSLTIPAIASPVINERSEEKDSKENTTKTSKSKEEGIIKCSYCELDVVKKYITAHLKTHINDYVPYVKEMPEAKEETSAQLTKPLQLEASVISSLSDKDDVSLKTVEHFRYREIDNISISASSSEDNRFSDFTVSVWLKDKISAYSTYHTGGGWENSKEFERIVINTTFDAIDEYYSVSVKLMKNSQYSAYSGEEAIPERLCFDQTEISEEIKRALLFFKVPPRSVYKRFRKAIRNTDNFIIDRDEKGRVEYVQTANTSDLFALLKSKQTSTVTRYPNYNYGG